MKERVIVKDGVSKFESAKMVYMGRLKVGRNEIRWVIHLVLVRCCLAVQHVGRHSELG
jgi:hypothetical protein